jgi:cyclophilin family peptidyl-prolyl cis-trans isomerase
MRFENGAARRSSGTGAMLAVLLAGSIGAGTVSLTSAQGTPEVPRGTPVADLECWSDDEISTAGEGEGEGEAMARQYTNPPEMRIDPTQTYTATLETNRGDIQVEFYPQDAPETVNNFVCLAQDGFYDGTPFHRIVSGFVIQGGDPTGTGAGGPGYRFDDEPVTRDYERGTLAMANAGPNTNGSQFFIVLDDLRGKLPKNYTIFGKVTGGLDIVDAIAQTPTTVGRSGEKSTPTEPVTLERVTVSES